MRFYGLALILVTIAAASACRSAAPPVAISNRPVSINDMPTTNQPMPPSKPVEEMQWTTFDGKTGAMGIDQKLKTLKGKVVVLDFWATYCPPCLEMIPHLREIQAKYKDDVVVIGLHVGGEEDFPRVPSFVEKLKIDYLLATPENALVKFIFGNRDDIPQTAIFDRENKLVKKFIGYNPEIKKEVDDTIEAAVNRR